MFLVHITKMTKKPDMCTLHQCLIRTHHECEVGIGKSVLRITVWHHEAYQIMTKGDPE